MAQLPPQFIHVKRKRTENEPVGFLRIESLTKRQRSNGTDDNPDSLFVYRRSAVDKTDIEAGISRGGNVAQASLDSHSPRRPVIHSSKPGDERRPLAALKTKAKNNTATTSSAIPSHAFTPVTAPAPAPTRTLPSAPEEESSLRRLPPAIPQEPRRFHLSRKNLTSPDINLGSRPRGIGKTRSSRRAPIPAVFVERNQGPASKKAKKTEQWEGDAALDAANVAAEMEKSQQGSIQLRTTESVVGEMDLDIKPREVSAVMPKRPGTKRVIGSTQEPTKLPDSMMNRWDHADTEKLALDMHDYAMQQIGLNLAEMEKTRIKPQSEVASEAPVWNTSSPNPKFKPNFNVKRYHERHPEEAAASVAAQAKDTEMADIDFQEDEDDYVTETYERILSDSAAAADVPHDQMGLLVLEGEPDIEFFYGEEVSDSDREYDDDEDENAENYYAADYPDEEVASDDEFDRDPYSFRNGNTSDHEEYGIGEENDEDEAVPSWLPRHDSTRFGPGPVASGAFGRGGR